MSALDRATERIKVLWSKVPRIRVETHASTTNVASPVATYYLIVVPALLLAAMGLLMAFSASTVTNISQEHNPYVAFMRPAIIIIGSVAVAAVVQRVRIRRWWSVAVLAWVIGMFVQFLVVTPLGIEEGGNTNWIYIPGTGLSFQPSELLKVGLALYLGSMLTRADTKLDDLKQMAWRIGLPVAASLGFVMLGHDLGTAMVIAFIAMGAMWVGGIPAKWFLGAIMVLVPVAALVVVQNPTRMQRILDILPGNRPERDLSAPTQSDHALWAFGSGGILGLGPGASKEKWNYLQAAHTDMVLAVVGEEFGLVGTMTVLICMGVLIYGIIRLCTQTDEPFVAVTSAGIASWILVQTVINVSSVTAFGPVIGVPLPLVSYGGSSFLFTAIGLAMVAAFAREEAGMPMFGRPDEASAGRDPRVQPKRRKARSPRKSEPKLMARIPGWPVARGRAGRSASSR